MLFGKIFCGEQNYEAQLWERPPQAGSPFMWQTCLNKEQNTDGHKGLHVFALASVASHPFSSLFSPRLGSLTAGVPLTQALSYRNYWASGLLQATVLFVPAV